MFPHGVFSSLVVWNIFQNVSSILFPRSVFSSLVLWKIFHLAPFPQMLPWTMFVFYSNTGWILCEKRWRIMRRARGSGARNFGRVSTPGRISGVPRPSRCGRRGRRGPGSETQRKGSLGFNRPALVLRGPERPPPGQRTCTHDFFINTAGGASLPSSPSLLVFGRPARSPISLLRAPAVAAAAAAALMRSGALLFIVDTSTVDVKKDPTILMTTGDPPAAPAVAPSSATFRRTSASGMEINRRILSGQNHGQHDSYVDNFLRCNCRCFPWNERRITRANQIRTGLLFQYICWHIK